MIDPTGQVLPDLRAGWHRRRWQAPRPESARRALEDTPDAVRAVAGANRCRDSARWAPAPAFTILERPPDADLQREKEWLSETRRRAPVTWRWWSIHPDAVAPAERGAVTAPTTSTCPGTRRRVETTIFDAVREALVTARVRAQNLDRAQVEAMMRVKRPTSVTVDRRRRSGRPTSASTAAAVRLRRAARVRHHDRRPDAADADHRGEVQPGDRGAAVGGVAARADGRQDPRSDRRQHARAVVYVGMGSCC